MNKILIAFILLIVLNLINIISQLIRRKVILGFGELSLKSFLSFKIWLALFSNSFVLLVLFFSFLLFGINLVVFVFAGVNNVTIISWFLMIPTFLLTVFLSYIFLNEKIVSQQIPWLWALIILMIISGYVVYKFITV